MNSLKLLAAVLATAAVFPAQAIGNLADLRIHDRATGRDLPIHWHQGRAYVVGKPGNEYQVVVRNKSGGDLLAVVSVDGVNALSGETASAQQGGYVVSSHDWLRVDGWRKSLSHTAAFYFTSLGDSYAARTGRPSEVGVIGVALFQRQYVAPPRPFSYSTPRSPYFKDESSRDSRAESLAESNAGQAAPSLSKRAQPAPSAPLGTGHGREETSHATYVSFQRASAYPAETVSIYYDSHRNLVARGILRTPFAPRDPRPFPGFVPDPA